MIIFADFPGCLSNKWIISFAFFAINLIMMKESQLDASNLAKYRIFLAQKLMPRQVVALIQRELKARAKLDQYLTNHYSCS